MKRQLFIVGLIAVFPALAQHPASHDKPAHGEPQRSGYADMQKRALKALSEKQIADLRAGRGMMLALPAELNGYPGPLHTLELAIALGLSEEQTQKTQALLARMQAEAMQLGEQIIASEYNLDRMFKDRNGTVAAVEEATAEAAHRHGQLRAVHLRYHVLMLDVLTPAQVTKYGQIRGYN